MYLLGIHLVGNIESLAHQIWRSMHSRTQSSVRILLPCDKLALDCQSLACEHVGIKLRRTLLKVMQQQ